ncbi:glycoside hydrolase family 65 protein [Lacticaseibacillus baoqingensis]|uniref:Glycoside hydrolase family 65 protein n=1 Tax=Lacticaseibacillus baoqingensis TaxID=2486013 RepID=A0ABW4E768_9LACO|nr:glycoside hydrolase family 65 protein [Lacticaseibacillus baoqingensis]
MEKTWTVATTKWDPAAIVGNGNKFMTGNGYLGYRGTLDEFEAEDYVAVNLLGLYDRHGSAWREPVNAPNPFFTQIRVADQPLSVKTTPLVAHRQWLDLKAAVHHRETTFAVDQAQLTIASTRFASGANDHLLAQRYTLTCDQPMTLTLTSAIDLAIWDINGPHLTVQTATPEAVQLQTGEGETVQVQTQLKGLPQGTPVADQRLLGTTWTLTLRPEVPVTFEKLALITTSHDRDVAAFPASYTAALKAHEHVWTSRWARSDVQIKGDVQAQQALRYSEYQLMLLAPHHLDMSIPARGLSGQTYKGAVFWDTEMFMLPFFNYTDPQVASKLLRYRIRTLPAAQAKAKRYGYEGAFYAWESQEDGRDGVSDYNVTDVFSKRPMRTYFGDKQIHISGDIALALWRSYQQTGDEALLRDGAAVIVECAKFYYSYSYWKPDKERFELLDVLGPDEYHERVNNNAYTNKLAQTTAKIALAAMAQLAALDPAAYATACAQTAYPQWQARIEQFATHLYVPAPAAKTQLIAQFDGYFDLENVLVPAVRARLIKPNEYWGGAYGVAADTQVIKQADVVFMLQLFAQDYAQAALAANWRYYEPRTEHGSSLSASVYALLATKIGESDWAYPYFMKSATVDLTGDTKQFAGGVYIGGTHPAANAGAWQAVVQGFCGLQSVDGKPQVHARLPKGWQQVSFCLQQRSQWYRAVVTQTTATLTPISDPS